MGLSLSCAVLGCDPVTEDELPEEQLRQSHFSELVGPSISTIDVYLTQDLQQHDGTDGPITKALRQAIAEWNEVPGLRFDFELHYEPPIPAEGRATIHVDRWKAIPLPCGTPVPSTNPFVNADADAFSQIPANGEPGREILVSPCITVGSNPPRTPRILRSILMHEIGHAVGLRHTDWSTRKSCGPGSTGESADPNGAVYIPGTPCEWVGDPLSVMNACWNEHSQGKLSAADIWAIQLLYGAGAT